MMILSLLMMMAMQFDEGVAMRLLTEGGTLVVPGYGSRTHPYFGDAINTRTLRALEYSQGSAIRDVGRGL